MRYYVYRITCTHPESIERYYYGYRSTSKLPSEDNYWSSSQYVIEAINRYGQGFFTKKILAIFDTKEEALTLEVRLHEKFQVDRHPLFFNKSKQTKWGVNCTGAVNKGKTYEEIYGIQKASELRKSRSETFNKDNSGANNPMFGRNHSDEQKKKWSEQKSGSHHPTFGWKWITDGSSSLKVPPNYIVPEGWKYGRVIKKKLNTLVA